MIARFAAALALMAGAAMAKETALLNVSYDPTREFYREYNEAFARHWKETTGQTIVRCTTPSAD